MIRNTVLASTLTLLLAGGATLAFAQTTPTTTASPASTSSVHGAMTMHGHGDKARGHQNWKRGGSHERGGVIGDLRALERLYLQSGRSKDLTALYNDVLARSQDPRTRDYVYRRLARLQAQPANVDQAIATLRKGLDESLANEAKQHTQREQMRSQWQQRRAAKPASATP
ncbi:MAG: hypothetical protein ABI300_12085 [Rhodanobacter sp.]